MESMKNERKIVTLGMISTAILLIANFWIYCYVNHSVVVGLGMSLWNDMSLLGLLLYFILVSYGVKEGKTTSKVAKWILLLTTLVDFGITVIQLVRVWITPNFFPGYLVEQIIHLLVIGISIWYFIHTIFRKKEGNGNVIFCLAILVDVIYSIILEYLIVKDITVIHVLFEILILMRLPYFYSIRKKESARKIILLAFEIRNGESHIVVTIF